MGENKFSERDLQIAFHMGSDYWFEKRATYFFIAFVCGVVIGFMFAIAIALKP
jgi:hypothetical protein